MITYDQKLHAANIAAINAANDQLDIDIRLASKLQRTIDKMKLKTATVVKVSRVSADTGWL